VERTAAIIKSMTIEERRNPRIIDGSRKKRIAAGSGTSVQAVNQLLKQFSAMQKMFSDMSKGRLKGIPKEFMKM
jgi:signal recognition particle subunit SRP54